MVKLSIIIPTLNEERHIVQLLDTLCNQTYKNFEVVIVDGDSKDKTQKGVNKYKKKLSIRFILEKKRGVGRARNKGAKIAKGKYLFFLDADVVLADTFLKKCMDEFKDRTLDCATCYIIPISEKKIDRVIHHTANVVLRTAQYVSPIAPGYCILCTKSIFNKIKGFDENILLAEDVHFVERAGKLGKFRVLRSSKIPVSVRRLDTEGRGKYVTKYFLAGIYRVFFGEIKKDIFKYRFGSHK